MGVELVVWGWEEIEAVVWGPEEVDVDQICRLAHDHLLKKFKLI